MKQNNASTVQGSKLDLYQKITDKIIHLLEQETVPWRRTWGTYGLARNYLTGNVYRGINMILMNNTRHPVPYFLSFQQAKQIEPTILTKEDKKFLAQK